ncbi:hypothetical protein FALCPG4_011532 [Fusarium falciforme]
MSNQGSGPGDRLTYVEFQNRLAGFSVNSLKYLDLTSPVDDMDEAYPKLENVDDTIFRNTKYKGYFDANDQDRNRCIYWVDMLHKQLTEYRQRPNNEEGVYDSVTATLRQQTPNENGVGLDEATIIIRTKKAVLPEGFTYREVNVAQTFLNNLNQIGQPLQELRDKGINNRADLMNWVSEKMGS